MGRDWLRRALGGLGWHLDLASRGVNTVIPEKLIKLALKGELKRLERIQAVLQTSY